MSEAAAPSQSHAMRDTAGDTANPLKNAQVMAELIAQATGRPIDEVHRRLRREFEQPGITVAEDFAQRGITPYVFSDAMERFYGESDAFIFESAVWNRNRVKAAMRRWTGKYLQALQEDRNSEPLNVLCIGDGLGFDSAHFAAAGHRVTYHEVPGPNEAMARQVFARGGHDVTIITDPERLPQGAFDAVVCLDVLEHVPDPPAFVKMLLQYLRDDGRLAVHAPFYMIHPAYPTHLRANRVHSGSTRLYTQHGLKLVHGKLGWNPLMFQRGARARDERTMIRRLGMGLAGVYFSLGRWAVQPVLPVHGLRRFHARWFE